MREAHPPPGQRGGLTAPEVTEMLIAARSIRSLEAYLAARVAGRIGAAARWVDADKLPAGAAAMLRSQGESPRVLTAEPARERIGPDAQAFIAGLQGALPALVENALWAQSLRRLAVTDHLTGAHNRRYFYYLTGQVLLRARQENLRVALLLYDIDDFKRYNDTYGYAAGDDILRETACLVRKVTRSHDVVARIGGDEFAVLFWDPGKPRLPDSRPVDTAYVLADRFRRAVVEHRFPSLGPDARGALTISGGLASFPADGTTCRELLRKADEALKQAKRAGKNAIRLIGKE